MTMYENEVDYFNDDLDIQAEIKRTFTDDDGFSELIAEHGVKELLYHVTSYHKSVAQPLHTYSITNLKDAPAWVPGAVGLITRIKGRRQQLRKIVRDVYGQEEVEAINEKVALEVED